MTPPNVTAAPELPADVFEALVSAWADLLVADYEARHTSTPGPREKKPLTERRRTPYDPVTAAPTPCLH